MKLSYQYKHFGNLRNTSSTSYKNIMTEGYNYLIKQGFLFTSDCDMGDDVHGIIVKDEKDIIGLMIFEDGKLRDREDKFSTYIGFIYIRTKYRHKGILKNMLSLLEQKVLDLNFHKNVRLYTHIDNVIATTAYIRLGFKRDASYKDTYHRFDRIIKI